MPIPLYGPSNSMSLPNERTLQGMALSRALKCKVASKYLLNPTKFQCETQAQLI